MNARQPTDLVVLKGKKHLTKREIEERRAREIRAETDRIEPPEYLDERQTARWREIADELERINLMTNLDVDALARYVQSEESYLYYDRTLRQMQKRATTLDAAAGVVLLLEKFDNLRDKAAKQCRAAASDLGMTISGRCRIQVPKPKEAEPKQNKFRELG